MCNEVFHTGPASLAASSGHNHLLRAIIHSLLFVRTKSLARAYPRVKDYVCCLLIPLGYQFCVELRHLRYFVAVAEEENVTRAAARLHVSQPPLSRQIRDLEEEMGIALLERNGRSVKLTKAGRVFLEAVREVM
jgi:hypothetical protein